MPTLIDPPPMRVWVAMNGTPLPGHSGRTTIDNGGGILKRMTVEVSEDTYAFIQLGRELVPQQHRFPGKPARRDSSIHSTSTEGRTRAYL